MRWTASREGIGMRVFFARPQLIHGFIWTRFQPKGSPVRSDHHWFSFNSILFQFACCIPEEKMRKTFFKRNKSNETNEQFDITILCEQRGARALNQTGVFFGWRPKMGIVTWPLVRCNNRTNEHKIGWRTWDWQNVMKCGGSVIAPDSFTTIKHKMEMTLHLNDMDAHPRHNKGTRFFNFSMRVSERKRRMAEKCTWTAERERHWRFSAPMPRW